MSAYLTLCNLPVVLWLVSGFQNVPWNKQDEKIGRKLAVGFTQMGAKLRAKSTAFFVLLIN